MDKKVIIFGTGGNCIDILDALLEINDSKKENVYKCIGFLDDNENLWEKEIHGVKVLGPLTRAGEFTDCVFINGIGSSNNFWKKHDIILKSLIPLDSFETVIHPSASVSRMAQIGIGSIVLQNVTISSDVVIGYHVMILPNTILSHNDVVGNYTCIAGGVCVSGNVEIGHSCYIGTNSAIKSNVKIGNYCMIGMGSVVLKDVPENSVVVGNPARFLRNTLEDLF